MNDSLNPLDATGNQFEKGPILVCVGGFPLNTQTFVLNEIQALLSKGWKVHVLAQHDPKEVGRETLDIVSQMRIQVTYLDWRTQTRDWYRWISQSRWSEVSEQHWYGRQLAMRRIRFFNRLLQVPEIQQCRLVHCHFVQWGSEVGVGISELLNVPLTVIAHDSHLANYDHGRLRMLQSRSAKVYCVSRGWYQLYQQLTGTSESLEILQNGVRVSVGTPVRPLHTAGERIRLLSAGSLTDHKRTEDILASVTQLRKSGRTVQLDVFGDGPCRAELEQCIQKFDLCDSVRLHGAVPHRQVLEAMRSADVFVHASERESFGLVVAEAMSAGLPIVCSRTSGPSEIAVDGKSGLFFSIGDVDSLTRHLVRLIDDAALRLEYGRAGHQRILSRFDWSRRMERLDRDFEKIIGSNSEDRTCVAATG